MDIRKKIRIALICAAVLILLGSVALSVYLFFSNYQNVQLFRQAENNFKQGDVKSLELAEAQLLQLVRTDPDNEHAFILLARIAGKKKIYPEQVYYTLQAHKLNPLSEENEKAYIRSLLHAREFERLENFLAQKNDLNDELTGCLLYAAGQNGNIAKYRTLLERRRKDLISELAVLLYKHTSPDIPKQLETLENDFLRREKNDFQKQEILAAMARIYLEKSDFDNAEKYLLQAWQLNSFAFSPALGRFYANYRAMGKALEIFEKYLATYHDPTVALQSAELYCLLKKRQKIADLNKQYQADTGEGAMLLCYYFEVLDKFAANDIASCRQYLVPLQKAINTPLATFIYLCAELNGNNLSGVHKYYNALLAHRNYLDLQIRADRLLIDFIRSSVATSRAGAPLMQELASKVYWRHPDAAVGKILLLAQRQKGSPDLLLLADLQKRFPKDQGVIKIAVEHYLSSDLAAAEKLIAAYIQNFPKQRADMLRYRIILAIRQKKLYQASQLFQQNFSPRLAGEYWAFAISSRRITDLRFLARDPQYSPFCQAAIHLLNGRKAQALDILARADAGKNQHLLFYAAKTLAENDRIKEALALYEKFPENTVYRLDVLLNCSELYRALGNRSEAVRLAGQAYKLAPSLPVVQYCYANKLYENGELAPIADIVKLIHSSPYSDKMRPYLIASLEFRLKNSDLNLEKEKTLNTAERLLRLAPDNKIAQTYRKKIREMRK